MGSAITLAELQVLFTSKGAEKVQGDVNNVDRALSGAAERSSGALGALQQFAGGVGLLADTALAASTKAATSYQTLLTTIQNNTTMSNSDVANMSTAIQKMSADSGASLDQLGEGWMHAANFGFQFADAQKIVQAGMESAISTGSNAADTINVLSAAMKEFNLSGDQASNAMDVLHLAAAEGNMTLEQLVESGGKAISTAANLGDSITDVGAAFSTLTQHGFDASQAATQITGMLTHIVNPAKAAQTEIAALSKSTGIDLVGDFSQAGVKAKGLQGILADVAAATGGDTSEILKLIPALRGGQGALVLAGTGLADMKGHVDDLNAAMAGQLTPTQDAFARQQQTVAAGLAKTEANLRLAGIAIGTVLLPALASLLAIVVPVVQAIAQFAQSHAQLTAFALAAAGAIGTLIGGMAIFGEIAALVGPLLGPLVMVIGSLAVPIAGIAAAAAALYIAWSNDWGGIRTTFTEAWHDIQPGLALLATALGAVKGALGDFLSGDWEDGLHRLGDAAGAAWQGIQQIGGGLAKSLPKIDLGGMLGDVGGAIASGLQGAGSISVQLAQWLAQQVAAIPWATVWRGIQNAGSSVLQGLIAGANITMQLAQWLQQQIAAVPWATVWAGIQNAGSAILQGLTAGANIAAQLTQWLQGQVARVNWAQVWSSVQGGAQQLQQAFAGINLSGVATQFQDLGTKIDTLTSKNATVEAFTQTVARLAQADLSKIGAIIGQVADGFAKLAASKEAQQLLDQFAASGQQLQSALGPLVDIVKTLAEVYAGALVAGLMATLSALQPLLDLVQAALPGAFEAARGAIDVFSGALEVVSSVVSGVIKIVDDLIHGEWSQAWQDAQTMVQGVIDGLRTILQGFLTEAEGWFTAALGVLKQLWSDAWTAIQVATSAAISALGTIIGGISGMVTGELAALPGQMRAIGANIIQGLIDGISSMLGSLGGVIANVANTVTGGLAGKLGIHSPSTVMRAYGVNIAEGLALGMLDGQDVVGAAATQIGAAATAPFTSQANAAIVSDTTDATMQITDLYSNASQSILVSFDQVGKSIKDMTSANVTALGDMFHASEDLFKNQQTLSDLVNNNYKDASRVVTQQMIDDDTARADSARQLATTLVQQADQAAQQVIADYNAQQAAGGAGANAVLDAQLKADEGILSDIQSMSDTATSTWKSATSQMVADTKTMASQIKDALKDVTTTLGDIGKNSHGELKSLLGDTASSALTVTPGQLASDQGAQQSAIDAALDASAQATVALNTLLADQQAYAAALQAGNVDLANSINARIPAEQAAAQAARQAAQTAQQAANDATSTVKADNAALKQSAKDLASFDISQTMAKLSAQINANTSLTAAQKAQEQAALAGIQAQSDGYEAMYKTLQANSQAAYATLQAGIAGYTAAVQAGDTQAQKLYMDMINGANSTIASNQSMSDSILASEKDLAQGVNPQITTMTDNFKASDDAAKQLNKTLDGTAEKAKTAAASVANIGSSLLDYSLALGGMGADMVKAVDASAQAALKAGFDQATIWGADSQGLTFDANQYLRSVVTNPYDAGQNNASLFYYLNLLRYSQPPINVNVDLNVDGQKVAQTSLSYYNQQIRSNAPLVGVERVRTV